MTDQTDQRGSASNQDVTNPHPVNWDLLNRLHDEQKPHPYFDSTVPLPANTSLGVAETVSPFQPDSHEVGGVAAWRHRDG